jgi:hypothetical protein
MEYLYIVLAFLCGAAATYFTSYTKEKGKNRALEEDISRLEDEKQKISAKYQSEIEGLKKDHALDIEKRKYQYDEKHKQFVKYFTLLDEYNEKCNASFMSDFQPVITKFMASGCEADATAEYMNGVQGIYSKLYEEFIRVKNETNTIRLISSAVMDKLLDEVEVKVEAATDQTSEMLKFMTTPEFWMDQTRLEPYRVELEKTGQAVVVARNAVRERMKLELNEI